MTDIYIYRARMQRSENSITNLNKKSNEDLFVGFFKLKLCRDL